MKKSSLILMLILIAVLAVVAAPGAFAVCADTAEYTLTLEKAELIEVVRGEETLKPEDIENGAGGYTLRADDSVKIKAAEALGKDKEYIAKYTKNSSQIVLGGKYDYSGFPEENAVFAFVMKAEYATEGNFPLKLEQQGATNIGQFSVSGGKIQSIKRYDPDLAGDKWKELVTNTEGTSYSSLYRLDKVIIKINDALAVNKVYKAKKGADEVSGAFNNEEKTFSFTAGDFSGSYALVISQEFYAIRINVAKDEKSAITMSAGGAAAVSPTDKDGALYFTAKYNDAVVFYLNSTETGYHIDDFAKNAVSVKNQSGFKNNTHEKIEVKDGAVYKSASYSIDSLKVDKQGDEVSVAVTSAVNSYSVKYMVWKDSEAKWVTATGGDFTVLHGGSAIAPIDKGNKAHYVFEGWKEDKITVPLVLENITSNRVIYASYAKVKYKLTLNIGSAAPEVLNVEHGATVEFNIQEKYGTDFIYTLDKEKSTATAIEFDGKILRLIMPTNDAAITLAANPAHKFTVTVKGLKNDYTKETRFVDGSEASIALPAGYSYKVESIVGENTYDFSNIFKTITLERMPENDVEIVLKAAPVFVSAPAESADYNITVKYSGDDVELYGSEVARVIYNKLSVKGVDEAVLLKGLQNQFSALSGGKFIAMDLSLQVAGASGTKTADVRDNGAIEIKIKLEKGFLLENIEVYHYSAGAYSKLDSDLVTQDGEHYIVFYANEFSPFIIATFNNPPKTAKITAGAWVGMAFGALLSAAVIFLLIKAVKSSKKEQNINK